jgi:hypothetical protein
MTDYRPKAAQERPRDSKGATATRESDGATATFNGYCWQYDTEHQLEEVGCCASCGRYWGSAIKSLTCVCGSSVSLT